jgi:hypothetical protein
MLAEIFMRRLEAAARKLTQLSRGCDGVGAREQMFGVDAQIPGQQPSD